MLIGCLMGARRSAKNFTCIWFSSHPLRQIRNIIHSSCHRWRNWGVENHVTFSRSQTSTWQSPFRSPGIWVQTPVRVPLMPAEWMNEWGLSFHLRKNWAFLHQVLCSYLTNALYLNVTHLYLDHPIPRLKMGSFNSISLAPIPTCYWRSLPPIELKWSRSVMSDSVTPMEYSLPGFSVHGVFQASILEWVAISFSRDLLNPGIKPRSPALQADSSPTESSEKPPICS